VHAVHVNVIIETHFIDAFLLALCLPQLEVVQECSQPLGELVEQLGVEVSLREEVAVVPLHFSFLETEQVQDEEHVFVGEQELLQLGVVQF